MTTLAGSLASGYVDGRGSMAQFNYPIGIAVSSGGVVFVTDSKNNVLRQISPAGMLKQYFH